MVLRHAAIQATYAPSVYNTQPWILRLAPDELALHADPGRWLMSLDRLGRHLLISCGCALFNARTSIAADGWRADVRRTQVELPDATLIATITASPAEEGAADPILAGLNRRVQIGPVAPYSIPALVDLAELTGRLRAAISGVGAEMVPVVEPGRRSALQQAIDDAEEEYRRKQDERTARWSWAGVLGVSEWSNAPVRAEAYLLTAVLVTPGDTPADWVSAGECLQRILLELANAGYAADLCLPAVEVAGIRDRIHHILGNQAYPQAVLQLGPADPASPAPQRRLLVDVIRESTD